MISVSCLRSVISLDNARISMKKLPGLRGSSSISLVLSRRSSSVRIFSDPGTSSRSFAGWESSNQQNRCSSSWPEVSADNSDDSACRLLEGLNSRVSAATCAGCCGENKPEIQEKKPGIHCLRSNVSLRVTVLPDQYSCVKQPCTVRKALRTKLPRTRRPVGTPLRPCPGMRQP